MYSSPVRHWSTCAPVRLACIRHAASVHPEPGSNSPLFMESLLLGSFFLLFLDCESQDSFDVFLFSFQCSGLPLLSECSFILPFHLLFVKVFLKEIESFFM